MKNYLWTLLLVMGCAGAAWAQEPPKVELRAQHMERDANGAERYVPARQVRPGQVVRYEALVKPVSAPLKGSDVTLPIPSGMALLAGSITPMVGVTVSLDGLVFQSLPVTRKVLREGKEIEEEVPFSEFRAVRWSPALIPSGAGFSGSVRVRVGG